jgi:hypothetical protein
MFRTVLQDPCKDTLLYDFVLGHPDQAISDVKDCIASNRLRDAAKIALCVESHSFAVTEKSFNNSEWERLQTAIDELRPEWEEGFKKIPIRCLYNPEEALARIRETIQTGDKVRAARMFLRLPPQTQRELSPTPLSRTIQHPIEESDTIQTGIGSPIPEIYNEIEALKREKEKNPVLYTAQDLAEELCVDALERSPILKMLRNFLPERTTG